MPHPAVDTPGDKHVVLAHIEADRPVAPKRLVREVKRDERDQRHENAEPGLDRMEGIVGDAKPAGRDKEKRQNA